jgi:hypothetical protein
MRPQICAIRLGELIGASHAEGENVGLEVAVDHVGAGRVSEGLGESAVGLEPLSARAAAIHVLFDRSDQWLEK